MKTKGNRAPMIYMDLAVAIAAIAMLLTIATPVIILLIQK